MSDTNSSEFCIITPIFDDALRAVNFLIGDLNKQTYTNFKHILVSNGLSPKIKSFVDNLGDKKVIYCEVPYESTIENDDLVASLGKRRNYALKNFKADRYFFLDADFQLSCLSFFEKVRGVHNVADVITANIDWFGIILPRKPLQIGHLDVANYSISRAMAEKYNYPCDCSKEFGMANDFRFYSSMNEESHYHMDVLFGVRNGRRMYQTVGARYMRRK